MALGWPVSENGPMPGRPIRPVARWQLMMALTLSVPCADWFTPCEKQVTVFGVARNRWKKRATSPSSRPVAAAVAAASGAIARARASAASKPVGVRLDVAAVERASVGKKHQQPAEQRGVAAGRDRQEQVGVVARDGAARIDDDELGAAFAAIAHHALVQHRMAPGGVRADEHQQIGLVEIVVAAGHHVLAEGATVAGDRRGHAQPRIGVDVGRADEALHQLVGDVIVLGQQLAGEIERDRVRPVALDHAA